MNIASNEEVKRIKSSKVVNISLDDFYLALQDITVNANTFTSIFDNSTFANLKSLHDTYGVKFSCFCFTNNVFDISTTTTKFKSDFQAISDWLKFGFHSKDSSTNYAIAPESDFATQYNKFIIAVTNFAGERSLCGVLRLGNYGGAAAIMADLVAYGIKGVFAADDDRISYDLTITENNQLNLDYLLNKNSLNYFKTHIRYENELSISALLNDLNNLQKQNRLVLFTHESVFSANKTKIEESLKWLNARNYSYSFFDEIPNVAYLVDKTIPKDLSYSLGNNWSVRTGHYLKVQLDGKRLHIQGQIEKIADIVTGEVILTLGLGVTFPSSIIIPSVCFASGGSTVQTLIVIVQSNGTLTAGYRDSVAMTGNRIISLNMDLYIN